MRTPAYPAASCVMQLQLGSPSPVSEVRVRLFANVLAGYRWPGRGGFEGLKKAQQRACLDAAREALERLAREPA